MELDRLNQMLALGVKSGASDIHFRPGDRPFYRVNGALRPLKNVEALLPAQTRAIVETLLGDSPLALDVDKIQEHDFSYSVPNVSRFRVNVYRQRGTLAVILRIIPATVPTFEVLKLPPVLAKVCAAERGLILVTGATGSGKSSTLAAMVDHINKTEPVHILTIEDPIEFVHKNARASISQREIGSDTAGFGPALRSALRQDPDVLLVGEMRDVETIDIALKAAETGHLVLSTVHTTDVAKTVGRLVSVFPTEEQQMVRMRLADCLVAVVSQRLLPTVDGKGRVAAIEVMVQTKTVQEYIREPSKTERIKDVLEKGREHYGTQSFDQHLAQLFKSKLITRDVARAAASNPTDFERSLNFE